MFIPRAIPPWRAQHLSEVIKSRGFHYIADKFTQLQPGRYDTISNMNIIMPELADRAEEVFLRERIAVETEDETASDEDLDDLEMDSGCK
jgi:hypothetical protein